MSKIYCDLGEVPKGYKRGSMTECAKLGKIFYYGEKKVDSVLIEELLRKRVKLKESNNPEYAKYPLDKQIRLKIASVRGEIRKITRDMTGERDEKLKKKFQKQLDEAENKLKKLQRELEVAEKKLKKSSKRNTKRKSKKSTKRHSKKRSKKRSKKHRF